MWCVVYITSYLIGIKLDVTTTLTIKLVVRPVLNSSKLRLPCFQLARSPTVKRCIFLKKVLYKSSFKNSNGPFFKVMIIITNYSYVNCLFRFSCRLKVHGVFSSLGAKFLKYTDTHLKY